MKYLNRFLIVSFLVFAADVYADRILIDQIQCVVCGPEKNTPFSDTGITWKRGLDNKFIPVEQQIQREIVSQQIEQGDVKMDPTAAEKYVEDMKKQNNLSESGLEELFDQVGRTMQEGLDFLKETYKNEYFMHFKFKSQLVPTDEEVQAFYDEYPEFNEGYFDVRASHINFDESNRDKIKADVEAIIADPKGKQDTVDWSEPVRWMDEDVAEKNEFIRDMKDGEIRVLDVGNSFELYQLVAHEPTQIRPLEQRRNAIIDTLNRKKLEKMLENYNQSVREYIDVITFDGANK